MKATIAKVIIFLMDIVSIVLAITLAFLLYRYLEKDGGEEIFVHYLLIYPLYITLLGLFAYEGLYHRHYDLWHESRLILRAISLSFLLLFSYLELNRSNTEYSQTVLILAYLNMILLIPVLKRYTKIFLKHQGLWAKPAKIYGDDPLLKKEIFGNPYLGYIQSTERDSDAALFINATYMSRIELQKIINREMQCRTDILFVPLLNDFDFTHAKIYEMANTRTNLISLQNRLHMKRYIFLKNAGDMILLLFSLPFSIPIIIIIGIILWIFDNNRSIFYHQKRLGKNGKIFYCYKFRTMKENSDVFLEIYLKNNPGEREYYARYHKYRNDPRITPIGRYLRKLSLDELPQIFNVLKGEMSFVGPRPYMLEESELLAEAKASILSVKPGITGLWQVSGRNRLDFSQRIAIDLWYIRNWSLWLDGVIFAKTFKTVLKREGAY